MIYKKFISSRLHQPPNVVLRIEPLLRPCLMAMINNMLMKDLDFSKLQIEISNLEVLQYYRLTCRG